MNKRKEKKRQRAGNPIIRPRKSTGKKRQGKRPNPDAGRLPLLPGFFGDSVAALAIMDALRDATVGEKMLVATLIPMALKFVRGAKTSEGRAVSIVDSIFAASDKLPDIPEDAARK